jgi:hypothetical protein
MMMQIDELVSLMQMLREKLEELDTLEDYIQSEEETKPVAKATVALLRSYANYLENWESPNSATYSELTDDADEALTKAIDRFDEATEETA